MEAGQIFVERVIEPYVGWELIGVGGDLESATVGAAIHVLYNGEAAASAIVQMSSSSPRGTFSLQLPIEPNASTLAVVLEHRGESRELFTGSIAAIPRRGEPGNEVPAGFLQRVLNNLATGRVLAPAVWSARFGRWRGRVLQARQRLRHKLLMRRFRPVAPHDAYCLRMDLSEQQRVEQSRAARRLALRPTISILMPVHEVEPRWFRAAVQSVLAQTYDNWQLCIADDASTRVDLLAEFDRLPAEPRIRFTRRARNGHICAASNTAAELATGDFIALMDHDDALAPDALYEVAKLLADLPATDLIYSDEDKIDDRNHRYDPQHKPAWSPELLLSYNYINHFTVLRRSLFERVGRFRPGFEGSQDHDLLLRATEQTDRIAHIPRILYHWRSLPTSTASSAGVKGYMHTSGRRAVAEALSRRGMTAALTVPDFAKRLGLPVLALDGPDDGPAVAVIVYGAEASAGDLAQLQLLTSYRNASFSITNDETADGLNRAAASRQEPVLVFVAAGLKPRDGRWLSRMMAYAASPGVGAVGGRIGGSDDCVSYFFYHEVASNAATLAPGVMLTHRAHFTQLGGFDADRFNHTLFAVDYFARLRAAGLRCVRVGDARFEGKIPSVAADPLEELTFRPRLDRPTNPHFLDMESFALAGDAGLCPAVPRRPLATLVAAHNLNSPEGAPRYLSEIVLGLKDRGAIDPVVLSPGRGAGEAVYRAAGVPLHFLDDGWSRLFTDTQWSPREYEAAQNRIIGVLRSMRPEVVLANTLLTFPVVEAAARLGIPAVWIIHESYSAEVLGRLFSPFARHRCDAAFRLATRIVPASHDTAALYRRCDLRHAMRVIHNGISPAPIDAFCRRVSPVGARSNLGLDESKTHFAAIGTVCERKGQHALVEAAALLARRRRDFVCHIVGVRDAVPYANYVRHLAARRGVGDCIHLVAETTEPFAWYRAADAFVCTSHMETFSRAILEAEAFGLPIISTPCQGVGEQVAWGWNALCVPQGEPAALAAAMERLIADPELRIRMGRSSRARFHLHETVNSMLDQYQGVLQQAAGVVDGSAAEANARRRAA